MRGTLAIVVVAGVTGLLPHTGHAAPITFDNAEMRYSVRLPEQCRHVEGPGTLEAVCSVDLDPEKSRDVTSAGAFVLEVDAEAVPASAAGYGEPEFRREIPESVCGEAEAGKVKIGAYEARKDGTTTTMSAEIICPPIRFLGLPERKAIARYVVAPGFRYRLMVRAPSDDLETLKPVAKAFLDSFQIKEEKKP